MNPLLSQSFILEERLGSNKLEDVDIIAIIKDLLTENNYKVISLTATSIRFEGTIKPVARHEYINYIDEGLFELTTSDQHTLKFKYYINYATEFFILIIPITIGVLESPPALIIAALLIGYYTYRTIYQRRIASKIFSVILKNCKAELQ